MDDVHRFNIPSHLRLANIEDLADKVQDGSRYGTGSGFGAFFTSQIDPSLTWDFLGWLKSITKLPVIVKVCAWLGRGPFGHGRTCLNAKAAPPASHDAAPA